MYFGTGYGMKIESEKGRGTIVELIIPAIKIYESLPDDVPG